MTVSARGTAREEKRRELLKVATAKHHAACDRFSGFRRAILELHAPQNHHSVEVYCSGCVAGLVAVANGKVFVAGGGAGSIQWPCATWRTAVKWVDGPVSPAPERPTIVQHHR